MDETATALVRTELRREQAEARRNIHRGVWLIAFVPTIAFAATLSAFLIGPFAAFLALLAAAMYAVGGGIAGVASITSGLVEHRRCARALRSLDPQTLLPRARVIRE